MAITESVTKVSIQPRLHNGLDDKGNIKTVSTGIGATLATAPFITNMTAATEKVLNIVEAAGQVWAKSVVTVGRTVTANVDKQ